MAEPIAAGRPHAGIPLRSTTNPVVGGLNHPETKASADRSDPQLLLTRAHPAAPPQIPPSPDQLRDMKQPQQAKVDVYTSRFSPPCMKVKALLDGKSVTYNEFFVDRDEQSRTVMVKRSGGRTDVPQIFINGRALGGFEELHALELGGQLDLLLSQAPPRPSSQLGSSAGPGGLPRPRAKD